MRNKNLSEEMASLRDGNHKGKLKTYPETTQQSTPSTPIQDGSPAREAGNPSRRRAFYFYFS